MKDKSPKKSNNKEKLVKGKSVIKDDGLPEVIKLDEDDDQDDSEKLDGELDPELVKALGIKKKVKKTPVIDYVSEIERDHGDSF